MSEGSSGRSENGLARQWLRRLLLAAGFLFVALLFRASLPVIREHLSQIRPLLLLASILCVFANVTMIALHLQRLVVSHGVAALPSEFVAVFARGQILKYIPGKLWYVYYQMNSLAQPGAVKAVGLANLEVTVVLLAINSLLAGFLLGVGVSPVGVTLATLVGLGLLAYLCASTTAYALFDPVIRRLPLVKRLGDVRRRALSFGWTSFFVVFVFATQWLSYALFLQSLNIDAAQIPTYTAILLLSWMIGLLAVIVPGGLGVREGGFILLAGWLSVDASFDELTAIAVLVRIWQLGVDVSYAAVFGWLLPLLRGDVE